MIIATFVVLLCFPNLVPDGRGCAPVVFNSGVVTLAQCQTQLADYQAANPDSSRTILACVPNLLRIGP